MDKIEIVKNKFKPRKKAIVPFTYNKIYDPFIKKRNGRNIKSTYKKGLWANLKVTVIDSVTTNINITSRVGKKKKFAQGFTVIIENTSLKKTMSLPLYRGCAKIKQEALDKNNDWIGIEKLSKEEIGDFYYEIPPYNFIYTKVPIYRGSHTTSFRVCLMLNDTSIYSNVYKSTIQKWMLR